MVVSCLRYTVYCLLSRVSFSHLQICGRWSQEGETKSIAFLTLYADQPANKQTNNMSEFMSLSIFFLFIYMHIIPSRGPVPAAWFHNNKNTILKMDRGLVPLIAAAIAQLTAHGSVSGSGFRSDYGFWLWGPLLLLSTSKWTEAWSCNWSWNWRLGCCVLSHVVLCCL